MSNIKITKDFRSSIFKVILTIGPHLKKQIKTM